MKEMRENEAENGRAESFSPKIYCKVIDSKFVQTGAYIGAQCIGNYQKNKIKSYYKDKFGRKPKRDQNVKKQKAA